MNISFYDAPTKAQWLQDLGEAFNRPEDLLNYLELDIANFELDLSARKLFALRVPRPFAEKMKKARNLRHGLPAKLQKGVSAINLHYLLVIGNTQMLSIFKSDTISWCPIIITFTPYDYYVGFSCCVIIAAFCYPFHYYFPSSFFSICLTVCSVICNIFFGIFDTSLSLSIVCRY